jgi:dihydroxy-acid dehydratase
MADIDRMSRKVPCLAKVAPATQKYHMEDVHRAGGIMAILGELDRAGLINRDCPPCTRPWAKRSTAGTSSATTADVGARVLPRRARRRADAGRVLAEPPLPELDLDRANGCIRDKAHAYSQDGGLAVLYGNIAEKGCIVKTAGVDDSILKFTGRARVCESRRRRWRRSSPTRSSPATSWSSATKGPKGGPGMQEMLYPTSYLKSKGLGKAARCSPTGASPAAPRACRSATPRRKRRPAAPSAWWKKATPSRSTFPTGASILKAYAAMTTSADTGAVRDISQLR